MNWRSTKLGQFPNHGEKVVGFSTFQGDKCIDVVYFYKGITEEERATLALQGDKRAYIEKMEDVGEIIMSLGHGVPNMGQTLGLEMRLNIGVL